MDQRAARHGLGLSADLPVVLAMGEDPRYVFNTGSLDVARYLEITRSVTPRFLFWINVALLFGCASVGIDGPTPYGSALFLTMTAVLFSNALFHIRATLRMRRYSPGVITGIALYLPLTICGYAVLLREGLASPGTAVVAAILGGSYPFLSVAFHRVRAMR